MIAKIIDKNKIEVYDLTQFDIAAIMHSGQVFRYFEKPRGYLLVVGNNYADIDIESGKVVINCNDSGFFWNYFDLDTDYNEIKQQLYKYESISPAIAAGGGIRILRSEFNEMVISFIISANNNIKRFTKTLNRLAEGYGNKLPNGLYSFPTLEQLSPVTEADYKAFGCGYRAPYLVKAVERLKKINIDEWSALPKALLDKKLLSIPGIGPKVCSCVKLFSGKIHQIDACPLDTWLHKALEQLNENDREVLLNHKYAGIAQQYIFYYLQHLHKEL